MKVKILKEKEFDIALRGMAYSYKDRRLILKLGGRTSANVRLPGLSSSLRCPVVTTSSSGRSDFGLISKRRVAGGQSLTPTKLGR